MYTFLFLFIGVKIEMLAYMKYSTSTGSRNMLAYIFIVYLHTSFTLNNYSK